MKKTMKFLVLAVVFMAISTASVFAESGDKLILVTTVKAVKPAYQIWGYDPTTAQKGDQEGKIIDWSLDSELQWQDPSVEDVVLKIDLRHVGTSVDDNGKATEDKNYIRYRNTAGVTLTVTPTELIKQQNDANDTIEDQTALPTAGTIKLQTGTTGLAVTGSSAPTTGIVTVTPTYTGEKLDVSSTESQTIASWEYTWAKDETLAFGEYQATITLTYTVA